MYNIISFGRVRSLSWTSAASVSAVPAWGNLKLSGRAAEETQLLVRWSSSCLMTLISTFKCFTLLRMWHSFAPNQRREIFHPVYSFHIFQVLFNMCRVTFLILLVSFKIWVSLHIFSIYFIYSEFDSIYSEFHFIHTKFHSLYSSFTPYISTFILYILSYIS